MIITRLRLENWKNFREAEAELGKRVFLIGPNASGKSNFLDAIKFLRDVAENGLAKAVGSRGGISALRCLAARHNPEVAIEITLDEIWSYRLVFGGKKGAPPRLKEELVKCRVAPTANWETILERPGEQDREDSARLTQTALEQISANKDFREIFEFLRSVSYLHILPQVVRDPLGFSPNPVENDPYGRDFVRRVWNTKPKSRDAHLKKINTALKAAVPQFDGLDVELDKKTGVPHLIANYQHWRFKAAKQDESALSDGTLRLLALFWAMLETRGSLLLEEPELSLHKELIKRLPGLFAKLDSSRKKESRQVIISTHSSDMLEDQGLGPGEILILKPGANGTIILPPDETDRELMRGGLSPAQVLIPKTAPTTVEQLSLFNLS